MAGTSRRRPDVAIGTPDSAPTGTPPFGGGGHDHSYTLQLVMELQRSVAMLQASVEAQTASQKEAADALRSSMAEVKSNMTDVKGKVTHLEKVAYAAGIVIAILVVVGGWFANTIKDVGMTYFKASLEHRAPAAEQTKPEPPAQTRR